MSASFKTTPPADIRQASAGWRVGLDARVRHLLRACKLQYPRRSVEALVETLQTRSSPADIRADLTVLIGPGTPCATLQSMMATDHPIVVRAVAAGVQPGMLLGAHELAEHWVERSVERAAREDGIDKARWPAAVSAVTEALGPLLLTLQRAILTHPHPDRVVHVGRLLDGADLGPARRAYLRATAVSPAHSVVGYVEHVLNGTPDQRRALVDWTQRSETHLRLHSGISIPNSTVPEPHQFSALELLGRAVEPLLVSDSPEEHGTTSPVEPSFFASSLAQHLHFPVIDALLVCLARPLLGRERALNVLVPPPVGPPVDSRSAQQAQLRAEGWSCASASLWGQWLGATDPSGRTPTVWSVMGKRLFDGLERIEAAHQQVLELPELAAQWIGVPQPGAPPIDRVRDSSQASRFDLDPVESVLDQQLSRLLLSYGRPPRETLYWLLSEWPEAANAIRSLAQESGLTERGVVPILHAMQPTRSLAAEKKAVSLAGRQGWVLTELDRAIANTGVLRSNVNLEHLPKRPWPAPSNCTVDQDGTVIVVAAGWD